MAKVDSTGGGRKDTPPGWLGSVAEVIFKDSRPNTNRVE